MVVFLSPNRLVEESKLIPVIFEVILVRKYASEIQKSVFKVLTMLCGWVPTLTPPRRLLCVLHDLT